MVRELSIGNDIVDLRNREPPLHPRYLERVLAPSEQDALRDSPDDLWVYWAAKEAAYKTLRRIRPGMGFHPRELVFQRELGIVTACSEMLSCSIHATSEYVSAICASAQRHQVCLQLDVRSGQVAVQPHQSYSFLAGEVGRGI